MRNLFLLFALIPCILFAALPEAIGWGVVTAETPAYDKTGQTMGTLKGGERYTLFREVSINKAPAYFVQIETHKSKPQCIIPGAACHNFSELPPTDAEELAVFERKQALCADYYSTLALRTTLIKRARERHFAKSPAKGLEKAKSKLATIPAKDRKYEEAQKKATSNTERLKYQDLRKALRWEVSGLKAEIARLEAELAEWEAAHPFNDSPVRKGAVWKKLTRQLQGYATQLEALGISVDAHK